MELNPIQAVLDKIEAEASAKSKAIIAQQEDYLLALQLVDKLKHLGGFALTGLRSVLCFYSGKAGYCWNIYAEHSDPAALQLCLIQLGAEIKKTAYSAEDQLWTLAGFPGLQIFMPIDTIPALAEAT